MTFFNWARRPYTAIVHDNTTGETALLHVKASSVADAEFRAINAYIASLPARDQAVYHEQEYAWVEYLFHGRLDSLL